jgi:hypothetical protein
MKDFHLANAVRAERGGGRGKRLAVRLRRVSGDHALDECVDKFGGFFFGESREKRTQCRAAHAVNDGVFAVQYLEVDGFPPIDIASVP